MSFEDSEDSKPNFDVLRRLSGSPKRRTFATIDIETRSWVHPYAVGFYDGTSYYDFIGPDCIEKALEFVMQPKYSGWWIYAHNGGNFDFTFFLHHLLTSKMEKKFKVEVTPVGSCMFRVDVYGKDDSGDVKHTKDSWQLKWSFIDSARLMPIKLDDLGETFGIGRKVELKMSYDDLALPKNRPLMRNYLKQDCVLLFKAVQKFQKIINDLGGQVGPTLPSTALDLFRRRFLKEDIYTNRHFKNCPDYGTPPLQAACHGCGHDFIRKAYYGGRAEIFRMMFKPSKGHETAKLYDVNSMYPACMLEPMPIGPGTAVDGLTPEQVFRNARLKTGIVDCLVEIPENCYLPPLPVRAAKTGKLIFPVGTFRGSWDTCELELLKKVGGRIVEVYTSVWFDEATIFSRFVRGLEKYRDKSSPDWSAGMDWIVKILRNASYGKLAMREERTRYLIHPDSIDGMVPIDFEADIWSEDVRVAPNYIVPQIAVHITALARRQLWEILHDVHTRGGRVYYCDTDSVVCSGVELKTGGSLGELKLENTITRAEFVLPKLYLVETIETNKRKRREKNTKIKAKGMGPGIRIDSLGDDELAGQLSEREFIDLVKNGMPIQRHRLTKFKEGLSEALRKGTTFPKVISSAKKLQSEYDKRIVLDDFNTAPIVMMNPLMKQKEPKHAQ